MMFISIFFIILASICNAIMDVISFHYYNSIFPQLGKRGFEWFNPSISWKNKYNEEDFNKGRKKLFWKINHPVQITDCWHLCKTLVIIFIVCSIVFYTPIYYNKLIDILLYGILWNCTFSLFYNHILIKKK